MKIGDLVYSEYFGKGKIVCIDDYDGIPYADDSENLYYGVEFERRNNKFHDLDGKCETGYGYWCTDDKNHSEPKEIITPYKFISTKKDLQTGDKLTTRDGAELICINNDKLELEEINGVSTHYLYSLSQLNKNLMMKDRELLLDDIVKVERPTYETVFERKEEILDEKEKEYLANVIKLFKDKVEYILKRAEPKYECIFIYLENYAIPLSYFEKGAMYRNMELGKGYTLKELGLDE